MTSALTDRILDVLARPEWKEEPPGSGVIAEVLHERRRDVLAALAVLRSEGKIADTGGNPHVARAGWALASPSTTAPCPHDLSALQHPIHGTAQLDPDGFVTVGVHADGAPARWQLRGHGRARHTTVTGPTGAGTSTVLRSLLAAAANAGVPAQVIDVHTGELVDTDYERFASSMTAARTVLTDQLAAAQHRLAHVPHDERPLALLVINDLHQLTTDPGAAELIRPLTRAASRAGIALAVGTPLLTLDVFGPRPGVDADVTRTELGQNLVLLGEPLPFMWDLRRLPDRFADGGSTAGLGYLPRVSDVPFRAWLP